MRTPGATAEETSVRVSEAAVRLFARKGFAATGIRELATEAGLTPAALYHYMGTKEDLLVAIMRSCLDPLLAAGSEIVAEGDGPEVRLAALTEMHVWLHATQPLRAVVADTELRSLTTHARAIVALRDRYETLWARLLAEGSRAGCFDLADERVTAIALLEMGSAVAHWYRPGGRLGLERLCALHADLALSMVRASGPDGPVRRDALTLPPPGDRAALHTF